MKFAPLARIALRYGVGFALGKATGDALALDADIVAIVSVGIGVGIESAYGLAKRKGWAT